MSITYVPGRRTGNRNCPLSLVITVAGPPISDGEVNRTDAPGRMPPCSSVTVPTSAPVKPCATTTRGNKRVARRIKRTDGGTERHRFWAIIQNAPFGARRSEAKRAGRSENVTYFVGGLMILRFFWVETTADGRMTPLSVPIIDD